ncbi:hypothetical protein GQ457_14G023290 [Hibiscus cannabinus]
MEACPDCIRDVTNQNRTALHIAVENKRFDVLRVLIGALRKKEYDRETVNRKDGDGNTALHLAARNDQLEIGKPKIRMVPQHWRLQNNMIAAKAILLYVDMDNISEQDRNALLVILGLLLTTTYQTCLSPPGGVWQGGSSSKFYRRKGIPREHRDEYYFLLFYSLTYVVFIVTYFLTLALLKPYPHGFRTALQVLLAFLAMCFDQSISSIAPTFSIAIILHIPPLMSEMKGRRFGRARGRPVRFADPIDDTIADPPVSTAPPATLGPSITVVPVVVSGQLAPVDPPSSCVGMTTPVRGQPTPRPESATGVIDETTSRQFFQLDLLVQHRLRLRAGYTTLKDCAPERLTWDFFKERFKNRYLGERFLKARRQAFKDLVQGSMTVAEYEIPFLDLLRYGTGLVSTEKDRCEKFLEGLRIGIRDRVATHHDEIFEDLVNRAKTAEELEILVASQSSRDRDRHKGRERDRDRLGRSFTQGDSFVRPDKRARSATSQRGGFSYVPPIPVNEQESGSGQEYGSLLDLAKMSEYNPSESAWEIHIGNKHPSSSCIHPGVISHTAHIRVYEKIQKNHLDYRLDPKVQ